jgi:NTP pyrophosphatase (non-canonical NTP hydrolase)
METLQQLKTRLREFVAERDWEQFHSPKNLSMALTVEAAELQEQFQWLTEAQSRSLPDERRVAVEQEIADVQIYLVRLADVLGVDIGEAVAAKMELNKQRYPVEKARGRAQKYTDFEDGG